MAAKNRIDALVSSLALLAAAAVVLVGLSSFGIWDPWEIDLAERVRSGSAPAGPPLGEMLLRASLRGFGVAEWSGRLPVAIAGVVAVFIVFVLGLRSGGARVGAYGALVAATSPLLLFNARTMIGHAVPMAAQAGLGLSLFCAVFPGRSAAVLGAGGARRVTFATAFWLLLAAGFATASIASAGLLEGALPPLVAVAILAVLDGRPSLRSRDARDLAALSTIVGALVATIGVALAIAWDHAGYSAVTGGAPGSRTIRTFEAVIEEVIHGFAPWSALLLVALAQAIEPRVEVEGPGAASTLEGARHRLSLFAVLWAAGGYASAVLFDARYGAGVFLPVGALAIVVASFLVSVEESGQGYRMGAVVAAVLTGLLLRDFALYPDRLLAVLGVEGLSVPEDPRRKVLFAVVLGGFAAASVLSLGVAPAARALDLGGPYRFLRAQWERGAAFKLWLLAIAAALVFCAAFGAACLALGDRMPVGSLAVRAGRALFFLPAALPLGMALGQTGLFLAQRLGPLRLAPLLLAGLAAGVYFGHGYLPAIGEQYSSREIYGSWNQLRREGEDLMIFGLQARTGAYYADGDVLPAGGADEVVAHLAGGGRRWALFSRSQLAAIDTSFRARTGRHVFVAGSSNERTVLVSNEAPAGERDQNPLAAAVRASVPSEIDRRTDLRFGENVDLVGYDLDLPRPDYVGAGERFTITWYWRVRGRVPGNYQVFLHIDGPGGRIHGDHVPADGRYPISMWQPGDVVVDRQEIKVPEHITGGEYTLYVGLWSGPSRLPVTLGEEDGADRAIAGRLQIR